MTATRAQPAPRPALRKAADGSVHPASPRGGVLRVLVPGEGPDGRPTGRDGKGRDKGKKGRGAERTDSKDDKIVEVVVAMPKSVRRRLRRKAEEYGWSAEEAAYHLARTWVES